MKQRISPPLLYKALLLAALAVLIPQLHMFRPAGLTRAHSQDMANAILGSTGWFMPSGKDSKPNIVVLLADEEALRITGETWPPREGFHAAVMRELSIYQPAAVFMDFLLMDRRDPEGARELKRALLDLTGSGDEVANDAMGNAARVYLPLVDAQTLSALNLDPAERTRFGMVGVRHVADAADSLTRQYPVYGGPGKEPVPSAAAQMWCDWAKDSMFCTGLQERRFTDPQRTFELIWNTRPHPFNASWHARDCHADFTPGWLDMVRGRWRREGGCPSVMTLFVSDLVAGAGPGQTAPDTTALMKQLKGSMVLYGSGFSQTGDVVVSGVVGEMPGVFYHAAALENLRAFDGQPKMRRAQMNTVTLRRTFEFAFLAGLALLFLHRQRWMARFSIAPKRNASALRGRLVKELTAVPAPLVVLALVVLLLVVAWAPPLRLTAVLLLSVITIATEILRGTEGRSSLIVRRAAVYATSVLASLLALFLYAWFCFHVLDEPPVDWLGMTAFVTFGWFLAQGAVGPFVDDLWAGRLGRIARQGGVAT